ncbi:MAG: hypothetical protein AAGU11_20650, partial [Syntrophobacteraceae bacterium]
MLKPLFERVLRGLKITQRISLILATNLLVATLFLGLTWYGMLEVRNQFNRAVDLQKLNRGVALIH